MFIAGLEEGVFPGNQTIYAAEKEMEEERRLMYVGITRAKRKLYLTNAFQRLLFGMTNRNRPSRFLTEIPAECVENASTKNPYLAQNSFDRGRMPAYAPKTTVGTMGGFGVKKPAATPSVVTPLKVGDRVTHKTFGGGLIVAATPVGGDVLLTIAFDSIGTKKLMQKFAKLDKE